jgi:hypothetical protein
MSYLIIVRRGQTAAYETLNTQFAQESGVRVMWDRRQGERRDPLKARTIDMERRARERRRPAPTLWETLGILVVAIDA